MKNFKIINYFKKNLYRHEIFKFEFNLNKNREWLNEETQSIVKLER